MEMIYKRGSHQATVEVIEEYEYEVLIELPDHTRKKVMRDCLYPLPPTGIFAKAENQAAILETYADYAQILADVVRGDFTRRSLSKDLDRLARDFRRKAAEKWDEHDAEMAAAGVQTLTIDAEPEE